ncbi:MAG: hypothetical protein R2911_36905 [Caldilineaceae bacterium]
MAPTARTEPIARLRRSFTATLMLSAATPRLIRALARPPERPPLTGARRGRQPAPQPAQRLVATGRLGGLLARLSRFIPTRWRRSQTAQQC